jgi:hypothetical protein
MANLDGGQETAEAPVTSHCTTSDIRQVSNGQRSRTDIDIPSISSDGKEPKLDKERASGNANIYSTTIEGPGSLPTVHHQDANNDMVLPDSLEDGDCPVCTPIRTMNLGTQLTNRPLEQNLTDRVEFKGGRFPVRTGGYSDIYIGFLRDNPSSEVRVSS